MRTAITALVITLLTNFVGIYLGWYKQYSWFDVDLHLSGGFFIALLFSDYLRQHLQPNSKLKNIIILVGATMLIGTSWEFAEYVANHALRPILVARYGQRIPDFMGDLDDTIKDLTMDFIGGLALAGLLHRTRRTKTH